jgi:Ca2+-binding RTX toxin-like protein
METRHSGRALRSRLRGFEQTYLVARDLVVRGTGRADDLRFQACTATVRGRGGPDAITQSIYGIPSSDRLRCQRRAFHLLGNGGDDYLGGSTGRDLLVGGPGRDVISGNAGRDTCSGEMLRSCEVKRR